MRVFRRVSALRFFVYRRRPARAQPEETQFFPTSVARVFSLSVIVYLYRPNIYKVQKRVRRFNDGFIMRLLLQIQFEKHSN